jgi:hypothetical protein
MHWFAWLRRQVRSAIVEPAPLTAHESSRSQRNPIDGETADGCEAFLSGHLAEYRITRNQHVSAWEWTNFLAHATEDEVRAEVRRADQRRSPPGRDTLNDTWRAARSYLAVELLDLVELRGSLRELQRSMLVPLELDLAQSTEAARWRSHEWVMAVEAVLSERRRAILHTIHQEPHPPR